MHTLPTQTAEVPAFCALNLVARFPTSVKHLLIGQSIEYAVATEHNEVVEVGFDGELTNLRLRYNHAVFTPVLAPFRLNVTKRPWNGQSSRENSMRAKHNLLSGGSIWVCTFCRHILYWLRLVNTSSILDNAIYFVWLTGSVVSWKQKQFATFVGWHNCSAVTHVGHITFLLHNQHNYCATATPFVLWLLVFTLLQKPAFCLQTPRGQGLGRVFWKGILADDYEMQLVFEEVRTGWAAMAVVNSEVGTLGPHLDVFAIGRSCHVQNNGHSVFVVVPLNTLVRVCRVTGNQPVRFRCKFGGFKVF